MLCLSGFELYSRWVPVVTKYNVNPALRTLVNCALSTFIVRHNYVDIVSCQIMTDLYRLSLKSEVSVYILF